MTIIFIMINQYLHFYSFVWGIDISHERNYWMGHTESKPQNTNYWKSTHTYIFSDYFRSLFHLRRGIFRRDAESPFVYIYVLMLKYNEIIFTIFWISRLYSWLSAMLVPCLPLMVALLVCLSSTVTAQTLDHQQLDIAGSIGTNIASHGDFGGKHLSDHPTHSVEEKAKINKLRIPDRINLDHVISQELGSFISKNDLSAHHHKLVMPLQVQKSFYQPKKYENKT